MGVNILPFSNFKNKKHTLYWFILIFIMSFLLIPFNLNSNINMRYFNDQTIMGYIANIEDIDADLQAKETPPWVDFCLQYTFPPLDIEYDYDSIA